ncbi:MAG: DUF6265 family protein [Pseudomonadota bacterium]
MKALAATLALLAATPAGADELDWLVGCWETPSGGAREVWAKGGDGLYFGYAVQLRDGSVGFFEQLRIEKVETVWRYAAYPRGVGPTVFDGAAGPDGFDVVNPAHDFPQRIRYARDGAALNAEISLASGEKPRRWRYRRCENVDAAGED